MKTLLLDSKTKNVKDLEVDDFSDDNELDLSAVFFKDGVDISQEKFTILAEWNEITGSENNMSHEDLQAMGQKLGKTWPKDQIIQNLKNIKTLWLTQRQEKENNKHVNSKFKIKIGSSNGGVSRSKIERFVEENKNILEDSQDFKYKIISYGHICRSPKEDKPVTYFQAIDDINCIKLIKPS